MTLKLASCLTCWAGPQIERFVDLYKATRILDFLMPLTRTQADNGRGVDLEFIPVEPASRYSSPARRRTNERFLDLRGNGGSLPF